MKIFHSSEHAPAAADPRNFTGRASTARYDRLSEKPAVNMYRVTFQPAARTAWHSHTGVQLLLVIEVPYGVCAGCRRRDLRPRYRAAPRAGRSRGDAVRARYGTGSRIGRAGLELVGTSGRRAVPSASQLHAGLRRLLEAELPDVQE